MYFPNNISKNTIKVYHVSPFPLKNTKRILSVDLVHWKANIPKRLAEICVETIASNWKDYPIVNDLPLLANICMLMELLPTDLPLELTINKIAYDLYWLRCYKARWPKMPPPGRHFSEVEEQITDRKEVSLVSSEASSRELSKQASVEDGSLSEKLGSETVNSTERLKSTDESKVFKKTWKEYYLEMHLQDILEKMEPENHDPDKMQRLTSLCEKYVKTLKLKELRAPTTADVPDHIPLGSVLSGLSCLTELCICYKQAYVGEKFSWHIFNTTMVDIKNLSKGLACTRLQVFRIHNSDINCVKVKLLLKPLLKNESLKIMDFSHCKISDHGILAICKFVLEQNRLEELLLSNNYIGSQGARGLAYILSENCSLTTLDLRLNMINSKGGKYLNTGLMKGARNLRTLILSGCGLTGENKEIEKMLHANEYLEILDLSNNRMGEGIGQAILEGMKWNRSLKLLDVRRCNIIPETEYQIRDIIVQNRKLTKPKEKPHIADSDIDLGDVFPDSLISEINSIFSN